MARASSFNEHFTLSFSSAAPAFNNTRRAGDETVTESKPETKTDSPRCIQRLAEKTKKAIEAVRRLGLYYKNHLNQLVASNIPSDHHHHDAIDAGSTSSYGDEMASEEELMQQVKRHHLDYVFYIGPNNSPVTTSSGITPIHEEEEQDNELRCPDISTVWAEAYAVSESDSYIERIEQNTSDQLYSLGADYEPEKELLENHIVDGTFVQGLRYARKYHQ
ncbi:hypothetical protein UA08_03324 [Talaromyces atroroseus]|uniref:Uncharacterized protein n=1 Tax=Talaromyces atroroseus TaxID=1441469 RepID=A0A225ANQ5_TALAT|nr:hypothetical protein UA08_03324 [Talaromyces atroroseus]OKL61103.1 hypothetical protein UA08_03324 [Talaromyces atroroseus]